MATPSTTPGSYSVQSHGTRRPLLSGTQRVGILIMLAAAAAAVLIDVVLPADGLATPIRIPLIAMIGLVYVAELAVVHLEFGRQAHSFSLSEFALVVGLYFADPVDLIVATVVGNLLVLAINRRQPLLKLIFNVVQFTLQVAIAIFVFQLYAQFGDPLGPFGWAGAILAMLAALLVSDLLINVAMRATGSEISLHDQLEAFGVTAMASLLNTSMSLLAVIVVWLQPAAAWMALVPPIALYVAYQAYMSQRTQQDRFRMLYQATRELHNSPRIEYALASAATSLTSMLSAEQAEIYLQDDQDEDTVWVTRVQPGERPSLDRVSKRSLDDDHWRSVVETGQAMRLADAAENGMMTAPLNGGDGNTIGSVVVINRLGDVAGFTASDLRTLSTFAAQIGASISNNRLIKSLAAATTLAQERESLIKAKDDFIASVSHELRTPLTTVLGLSQELISPETELDQDERAELVELIADQSSELSHLVDDLLVSARSDIGTLHMNTEAVDLRRELARVLRETCNAESIAVTGAPGIVWGDGLRLRQIIRNLIVNAQRYGGDNIRLQITDVDSHVTLSVIDDGPGVPSGMEETIFDAYGRAHEPGSQPASIGLGLHVARRLAERMGGTLDYRRVGGETRFDLSLRSVPSAPADQADVARAIS